MDYLNTLRQMRDDYANKVEALDQAINSLMAEEFERNMKRQTTQDDIPPVMMQTRKKKGGIRLT